MHLKFSWSIRQRILVWLFSAMALMFTANLVTSYFSNLNAADSAYDRLLLASASAIAERTTFRGKSLHVDIPYAALDMLASTAQDRVFYKIAAADGEVITGYDDLPSSEPRGRSNTVEDLSYYNAVYKGVPVRAIALRTFLTSQEYSGYATITVAQTRGDRDELTQSLLRQSAFRMLLIALAGALAAWIGVGLGLRPLVRLREALGRRSPDDVRPILHDVPSEFRPLVNAINAMLERLDNGLKSMRNFISDASHQLKTPLATLQIQGEMALRETDPEAVRNALVKVNKSVQRTSRLAQQLLSHARATDSQHDFTPIDLAQVARETIEVSLPHSSAKDIDLGYDGPDHITATGDHALLGELLLNLVDNAIKYSPNKSVVTISLNEQQGGVRLAVEDNGPGIPGGERTRVFERFVRLDKTAAEGCGLGLAIVREIATSHGAKIDLEDMPHGGLRVVLLFPPEQDGRGGGQ